MRQAQVGAEADTVGQAEVEEDQVDSTARQSLLGRVEACHRLDGEVTGARPRQELPHSHGVNWIIFDQQDRERNLGRQSGCREAGTAVQHRALAR